MTRLENVKAAIAKIEALHKELFHLKPNNEFFFDGLAFKVLPKPMRSKKAVEQTGSKMDKLHRLMKELYGKHKDFMEKHGLSVDIK